MSTPPATDDTTARIVDEQFFDLICTDQDLLAAEFDAIIAAGWHVPPAHRPGRGAAGWRPAHPPTRRVMAPIADTVVRPRHPGIGGWARERSPPPRQAPHRPRKAGDRHTRPNAHEATGRPARTFHH